MNKKNIEVGSVAAYAWKDLTCFWICLSEEKMHRYVFMTNNGTIVWYYKKDFHILFNLLF